MEGLSHVDDAGRARMVDVGNKPVQRRTARASGVIRMAAQTVKLIADNHIRKGDVLAVAQVAGIQAAKETAALIPLCHPLPLDSVDVRLRLLDEGVEATSEVRCTARTGAEMEALTAVSVALLTVYDMCKAADDGMRIGEIQLTEKTKGEVVQG